jgi:hypothetical protein
MNSRLSLLLQEEGQMHHMVVASKYIHHSALRKKKVNNNKKGQNKERQDMCGIKSYKTNRTIASIKEILPEELYQHPHIWMVCKYHRS